jgi:NADPH:quinone reductase-like Zn-dependent oxidoreductase
VRALTISAHGGIEQVEFRDDVPPPELIAPTDVRVRIGASALNRLDLWTLGGLPGVAITPRWVLGSDGAGVVDRIGDAVSHVKVGDSVIINPGLSDGTCEYCRTGDDPLCLQYRILGEHVPGMMTELVVVPARNVLSIPATVPVTVAAAFPLSTLTAWRMIVSKARVHEGDDVLIWGIGGGVAQAALQIAKQRGAHVWVTSSSDAKLERARALGADETLNHGAVDVAKTIRARTGKRGVTVVIDSVGQAVWSQSLGALGKRGRLVTCGGTSGHLLETDVRRMFWNQWTLMGSTMGSIAEFSAIATELRAGRLIPPVDSVHALADGREAFARLQSGEQFGKVVVRI